MKQLSKWIVRLCLLAVGTLTGMPLVPQSSAGLEDALVALHTVVPLEGKACDGGPGLSPCRNFNVTGQTELATHAVYLIVVSMDTLSGVGAVSCGVEFDSTVYVSNWWLCADSEEPSQSWPNRGSGNRISWNVDSCQRDLTNGEIQAIAGAFAVYWYAGPGLLKITPNPVLPVPKLLVEDCLGNTFESPASGGQVGFGGAAGFTPCSAVPVVPTTWGRMRALYQRK